MSRLPLISPSTTPRWNAHLVGPTVSSARSRSDSLTDGSGGGYASPQENALAYDFLSDVTIAVVGDSGCGKSVAISKGLKSYSLSEPVPEASGLGAHLLIPDISREGTLVYEHLPDRLLRVLEVDNSSLRIDGTVSGLPVWPENAPRLDGVIVCYDVSQEASFAHVEDLLKGFRDLKLPTVVFACKCDLERHVESLEAYTRLNEYDVGLIEVTIHQEGGKSNLRRGFDFLLESIFRERSRRLDNYQNPASPDVLVSPPPWEVSRSATATPIASSSGVYTLKSAPSRFSQPAAGSTAAPRVPGTPTSPTRARSTSDLLASEHEKSKGREFERDRALSIMSISAGGSLSSGSLHASAPNDGLSSVDEAVEDRVEGKKKDNRPAPWATLEELLDKLLFLAVSGDDRAYISHFLLTHRRFVTPRSVILAMQKRMRQLDQTSSDTMFACFAQMRICHLLEIWIQDYPHDFAVGNAGTALNALVKSIISKTHLLHYGSDFLPFLEGRPMVDKDADWALKVEESQDESDDSYNMFEDEDDGAARVHSPVSVVKVPLPNDKPHSGFPSARERKPSLPLMAKALVMTNAPPSGYLHNAEPKEPKLKQTIKELQRISQELYSLDPDHVAQEITRVSTKLFLRIEPRHWLHHTMVSGPKEAETNPIAMFSQVSNHLADWQVYHPHSLLASVVSLILCHDKTKARARQVEKLVEIAQKLRGYNNYSALRAFVAGINMATYQGDPTMELFQLKAPSLSKSFQSWDLLFQSVRSHSAYRMALRNTKGPCIPALEVHLSDLIKAHEGNPDFNKHDPTKIHWAKFSMMGKFILSTTQFQAQCRTSNDYNFTAREHINDLMMRDCVMDAEMQKSRITPPPDLDEIDDSMRLYLPRTPSRDNSVPTKDTALIRKLMFWGS
ncbi:hypothetical protein HETIRDRAFT_378044 [Heterobasidion irregulare TC 32-1]|uniref:Ras-GEF domain-containing protein n=1 Tax=Heterobasidion irregulare (strain TC 32-1) TaxID=747525 RepID=W4KQA6_HETIT|nr:uncharacterized protein HETIRDRAFT_378044 [Heterobasidion irregulare TC 32-1]ETW87236.1 hypothetical protein HETIRDRAFT_378044 [Heterobasidion irregulare TC 32-1]